MGNLYVSLGPGHVSGETDGPQTILKNILDNLVGNSLMPATILSFFFQRNGVEMQRSVEGMLRTFLYQLLSQPHSASSKFRDESIKQANLAPDRKVRWQITDLRRMFLAVASEASTGSIVLIIDALDEGYPGCGEGPEPEPDRVLDCIISLFEELQTSSIDVRLVVACRTYPLLPKYEGLEIFVDKNNERDINAYIMKELERRINYTKDQDKILETLHLEMTRRAESVFVWAILMCPKVANWCNAGEDLDIILKRLHRFPSEMEKTYSQIFRDLINDEDKRSRALRLFQWVLFSRGNLNLNEIHDALEIKSSLLYRCINASGEESLPAINADRTKNLITNLSGGLVEAKCIWDNSPSRCAKFYPACVAVQFIHLSVQEYLEEQGFAMFDKYHSAGQAHLSLYMYCVEYLILGLQYSPQKIQQIQPPSSSHDNDEPCIYECGRYRLNDYGHDGVFPLTRYAWAKWIWHARISEMEFPRILDKFQERGKQISDVRECLKKCLPLDEYFTEG